MASHLKNLSEYDIASVPDASAYHFTIVVSEWNTAITHSLATGAIDALLKHGAKEENIRLHHVPGSFELPSAAEMVLHHTFTDAVICIGCVIQGETRHFEFINQAVAKGIMDVSLTYVKPVIFGVLTPDNQQQALDRAGGKHGNKGVEAAITAIKMVHLQKSLALSAEIS